MRDIDPDDNCYLCHLTSLTVINVPSSEMIDHQFSFLVDSVKQYLTTLSVSCVSIGVYTLLFWEGYIFFSEQK